MMGLFFEECEAGMRFDLGKRRFTREAILRFARAYDPQLFHIDAEAAVRGPFGALIASGWHTAAGWMRCFVDSNDQARQERLERGEAVSVLGPSPGFRNLKWLKPV